MKKPKISVWCLVYNHENYLRQCLEGFVKQETEYDYEVIVHDDVSTDNSAAIIREYAERYPYIVKPIYEKENQWSKKDGSLDRIFRENCKGEYIAICEGDDCWIDSRKLQKQITFLESHPDYSMCCTDAKILSSNEELDWSRYDSDSDISPSDMIIGGGLYIQTCTLVYRRDLIDFINYEFVQKCHIGDYPLQIAASLKGKVRYINEKTAIYRYENQNSWTYSNIGKKMDKRIEGYRTEIDMLLGFDEISKELYHRAFSRAIANTIYMVALFKNSKMKYIVNTPSEVRKVMQAFQDVKWTLSISEKIDIWLVSNYLKHVFFFKRYLVNCINIVRR